MPYIGYLTGVQQKQCYGYGTYGSKISHTFTFHSTNHQYHNGPCKGQMWDWERGKSVYLNINCETNLQYKNHFLCIKRPTGRG